MFCDSSEITSKQGLIPLGVVILSNHASPTVHEIWFIHIRGSLRENHGLQRNQATQRGDALKSMAHDFDLQK